MQTLELTAPLEGSIVTSGKVVIGKDGYINGSVSCTYADVEGKFNGKIACQRKPFAKSILCWLKETLLLGKLIVESGATLNANCSMKTATDVKSIAGKHEKTA